MKCIFLLIILISVCNTEVAKPHGISTELAKEDTDWVNMDDMENFERSNHRQLKRGSSAPNLYCSTACNTHWEHNSIYGHHYKNYEKLQDTLQTYMRRYVSLFLITAQLEDTEVTSNEEIITADLEISLIGKDLIFLQNLSKNKTAIKTEVELNKLDIIMQTIIQLKEKSLVEKSMKAGKQLFRIDITYLFEILDQPATHYLLFIIASLVVCYFTNIKSWSMIIMLLANNLTLYEGLKDYFRLVEEAETAKYVKLLKRVEVPIECTPEKMKWYHMILTPFRGDPCLDYYKETRKNNVSEVSLLQCIVDAYARFFIQTPMRVLGSSTRIFTTEVTAYFSPPFNYIFYTVIVATFLIFTLPCLLSLLFRRRIKLYSIFGGIDFGATQDSTERVQQIKQVSESQPEQHFHINLQLPEPVMNVLRHTVTNTALAAQPLAVSKDDLEDPGGGKIENLGATSASNVTEGATTGENSSGNTSVLSADMENDPSNSPVENSRSVSTNTSEIFSDIEKVKEILSELTGKKGEAAID